MDNQQHLHIKPRQPLGGLLMGQEVFLFMEICLHHVRANGVLLVFLARGLHGCFLWATLDRQLTL
jgi:predicted DNA-binding protein with PD1-like motif